MGDIDLFAELKSEYGFSDAAHLTRGPTRTSGFPGLITVEDAGKPITVIKQHNLNWKAQCNLLQGAVYFHQRMKQLGSTGPNVVTNPKGFHGAVLSEDGHEFHLFYATEFVDGIGAQDADLSRDECRNALRQIAREFALMRVASRGLGDLLLFPFLHQHWLSAQAQRALAKKKPWAAQFLRIVPRISQAARSLPLGKNMAHVMLLDCRPVDAMVRRGREGREVVLVDWERIIGIRKEFHDTVLMHAGCSAEVECVRRKSWFEWASERGVEYDEALHIVDGAFHATLAHYPQSHVMPITDRSPHFIDHVQTIVQNIELSICDSRVLHEVRRDADRDIAHAVSALEIMLTRDVCKRFQSLSDATWDRKGDMGLRL